MIFRLTKSVGVFSNNLRCPILNQDLSQCDLENDGSKGIDSVIMDQFPLVRVCVREREREREEGREEIYLRIWRVIFFRERGLKLITMP